ncbi:MAG TPA: PAS domain-containing protein [Burkholderiaceae bacterium]|jgi:diguanylate cyclase (GGDEF)-like protein/PAS domain S-box-containing protein|nr:PAS domain-containing protein [Burkholderiaceae bacterium]
MNFSFAGLLSIARWSNFSIKTRMAIMVAALVLLTTIAVSLVSLLLVRQDMEEVIHAQQSSLLMRTADEIDQMERRAAIAAVFLAFIVGALAWWITRSQILPLQELRERIQRVQADPTQLTAPVSYRKDEIGALELSFDRLVRERLHAEAQFRKMEAELHASIDCSLDAFIIFKPDMGAAGEIADFRFSYLNAKAALLFDMEQRYLLKCKLGEILPVSRANGWFGKLVSVAASRQSIQGEYEVDSPAIHARWLHYQVVPLADGLAVTMRDISTQKHDEVEMRENRAFLQSLIEYLPVLIFAKSFKGNTADKLVVWNKTAEHVMGYSAEQVIGKNNGEIFPSKVADTLNALDRQMLVDPKVVIIPEFPYRRPDGELRYLHSISVPLFGEAGTVDYILGIVEDITVRRAQDWALRNQQAEMAAVNDALPLGLFRTDSGGNVIYVNSTFEKMTGLDLEEFKHHGWHRAVHADDQQQVQSEWTAAIGNDLPYQSTHRFQRRDGKMLWVSVKAAQIRLDGKARGYVGSVDDITARRQAEQAVLQGERWLRTITDNLPALIAYVDMDERYRFSNIHYERAYNTRDTNLFGRRVRDVFDSEDYALTSERMATALAGEKVSFERESVDQHGIMRYWRVEYIPDLQDAKVAGFYSMVMDITELKQVENRLRALARIDSLTGLANRSYFNEKLTAAIASSEHDKLLLAVMFLDIDHFKAFNDSFGHHGGDLVLREFSRRLTACIRHTDTVARLAGDEFVILLQGPSMVDETEIIAKKIMVEMERDFDVLGNICRVTTSIGITIRRNDETDIETLLRRADDALYTAKSAGRNTFKITL